MTAEEIFAGESENVEFKSEIPSKSEKYMKTVVAFANGKGGKLIFGVEDGTWAVSGFSKEEVFQKMDAITNAVFDSCEPKITPNIAVQEIDGRAIIIVEIIPGMQRPYYIKGQGIMDGTYIRVAGTTRHAERYRVQELIMEGTNRSFDQLEQGQVVSAEEIAVFCDKLYQHALKLADTDTAREQIQKVGKNQLLSWKLLVGGDGEYHPTNGYLLLAGDRGNFPDAVIQCAVFKGTVRDIFITRKEFSGAIYEQIENAYHFVLQHIDLGSRIEGIARRDYYELPVKTIRELISNAVCHRSYLMPGKIQVALFDDRLEVTSPGMLDNEITIEKMKTGLSKIRNRGIAAAFSYMNVIEAWGSGIPKIFREAKEYALREPELIDMGSDFRINLYRKKAITDQNGVIDPKERDTNDTKVEPNDTNGEIILNILQSDPQTTQKNIGKKLGVSLATVKRAMKELQENGKIRREGSSRSGAWVVVNQEEQQLFQKYAYKGGMD
ncbi:MAG: putative DNA binding domain-containing protein [Eubacteriales bacterium]|nr:putative DNA binding domain-containing protein [Eubacteriales bacterium]